MRYSATGMKNTYNHFGRLQAVKYTNIQLTPVADADTLLDCNILIQTNKPSTLSFQPEGTNTAGDLGAAVSLTYQNRNLFRGSEVLSVELRGAYEAIRGLEGYSNQDFTEYSLETRLQFPRFIMPFISYDVRHRMNATSEVSLTYDLQDRPEFHRRVLSAAWRYRWNYPNRHDRFQLDLLDLNYVFMPWISETFRREYLDSETSRNAILRYNYEDLFITKLGFGYTYSHGPVAVKTNIETSGNVLSLGSYVFNADKDRDGHYRLFNIAFAQYVKADIDLTRSINIDQNNQVVLHAGLGIAYPYGNSSVLPFEKRYFAGGANSVRGWSVRSLGPGKYRGRDGRINFINQTGDMKLDLNAEYRTHLFWKMNGAVFVDAGNVWTLRNYDIQPGGQFRLKDFPNQIAVSYGLGLRFNLGYFILRFDMGMKAVNPAYEETDDEHYPLLHPRFSRDYAFHFAVGMPF
jgi:outer membrane protein assembly factor BamA